MTYLVTAFKQKDDQALISKVKLLKNEETKEMSKDRAFVMRALLQKLVVKALVNGEKVDLILTPFDKKGFIKLKPSDTQADELIGVEKY